MRYLLALRVNLPIVIVGAFCCILLIHLTSLLPSKYYFNFSKLFGSDSSPLLVDPPSVTGKKLCAILRKNKISPEALQRYEVNCALMKEGQTGLRFSKEAEDQIYAIALQTDPEARQYAEAQIKKYPINPMPEEELQRLLNNRSSTVGVLSGITYYYERQIDQPFRDALGKGFTQKLANVQEPKRDVMRTEEKNQAKLSDEEKQKILTAHSKFLEALSSGEIRQVKLPAIKKSEIDKMLTYATTREDISSGLGAFYVGELKKPINEGMKKLFADQGLTVEEFTGVKDKVKELVYNEIVKAGFGNYIISILLRILPVLLVGLMFGLLFGRLEVTSIAFAGAFAAFMLSWPVLLLWDQVVQHSWQDKKITFAIFYLCYMMAFYFTARVGALIGSYIRQYTTWPEFTGGYLAHEFETVPVTEGEEGGKQIKKMGMMSAVTAKELAINTFGGIFANGLVYAWNIIIPFTSS